MHQGCDVMYMLVLIHNPPQLQMEGDWHFLLSVLNQDEAELTSSTYT